MPKGAAATEPSCTGSSGCGAAAKPLAGASDGGAAPAAPAPVPAPVPVRSSLPAQPSIDESCPSSFEVGGGAFQPSVDVETASAKKGRDGPRFSVASLDTIDTLAVLEIQLKEMKIKCDDAETFLGGDTSDPPQGMRNGLAQLHGDLNKLLATKLDAILTGDLNTGRDAARAKRKELIKTTESMIERVEDQVKRLDKRKAG